MHGLGRHRPGVDLCRRCADLARVRRANAARRRAVGFHVSCRSATATSASTSRRTPTSRHAAGSRWRRSTPLPRTPDFLIHTGDLTHLRSPRSSTRSTRCSNAAAAGVLRARRTRYLGRRRKDVSRALRQRHEGKRLVQLRPQGRALRRAGNVVQLEGMGKLGRRSSTG